MFFTFIPHKLNLIIVNMTDKALCSSEFEHEERSNYTISEANITLK